MLSQIQRFGGAMFTPVLLFPFAGIVVGLAILLQNPMFVGESLTDPNSLFAQIVHIIEEGGWTVFRNMPLIFAVGLPIGLAKQAQGRACLAVMVSFLTWNYFIYAMGMTWGSYFGVDFTQDAVAGSGLTMMAGIKTLDTSIIGAIIISGIVTALHNRLFDKKLPVFLGIFQGTSYVVIIAFLVMIPCAWLTLLGWPKVQMGIESLQAFLRSAGALGVWVYTFLERILIPTGLHHFIYGPFIFGLAAVEGGIQMYWAQHLQEFSLSAEPLKSLFPEGGFALHGNSKIFGAVGISLAMYFTAAPENRVKVAGLLIPATLTAMLVGITEPLEFTFLFISPLLFAVHAVLAASMSTVMYLFGVVGNMGGGLIDQVLPQNWIPMFSNHADMMLTQIAIGLCFTLLYFVVFRTLILQFNMCTPGREDAEVKLYSKAEYKASRGQTTAAEPKKELDQAAGILQALGGVGNISSINNCATRLRIALHDMSQTLDDEVFKKLGAHGVFRSGDAIQVIIGLHVSQLREQLDSLINSHQSAENVAITEAV
ncbi:MAG: PTS sugar transporter subunit IIB [Enterobacteriaceae bacterium]